MNQFTTWDGTSTASPLGYEIFIRLISFSGIVPAYILLFFVSWYYVFFDSRSNRSLRVFRSRCGIKKTTAIHRFLHFYSFGMCLADRMAVALRRKNPFRFLSVNECFIRESLSNKSGVILLTAHIGNWEIAANMLTERVDTQVHVVLVDKELTEIKDVLNPLLQKRRFSTIAIGDDPLASSIEIKKSLAANHIVCLQGDRTRGEQSVETMFLGHKATLPHGPFLIAALTKSPIVPIFTLKNGFFHYTIKAFQPVCISPGETREGFVQRAMRTYVEILESVATRYPYQWYNFYDFWQINEQQEDKKDPSEKNIPAIARSRHCH
ncbi:MAG: lysophospholipid acyltransferase family protein [Chitinivibrionales bacterium]|nr:lysophospholipid acyltransferase family protein [Chitinivibrionales bacterium]